VHLLGASKISQAPQ